MWLNWKDLDRHFATLDTLRREMERGVYGQEREPRGRWSEVTLWDEGKSLMLTMDVPGVSADDLTVDVHNGTVTVGAKRRVVAPEGYATHRNERVGFDWHKSVTLPAKVDADRTSAKLHDGVLYVRLDKLPEAQPRRIAIGS
ncbi:MAG: hypothetical protein CSA66_05430 [Proteobacteria bacterium]|nr:MAG: hypothetical protein CSA66_05430 [Pseudomonadota bacterium]